MSSSTTNAAMRKRVHKANKIHNQMAANHLWSLTVPTMAWPTQFEMSPGRGATKINPLIFQGVLFFVRLAQLILIIAAPLALPGAIERL
jgi:hypothetical protein